MKTFRYRVTYSDGQSEERYLRAETEAGARYQLNQDLFLEEGGSNRDVVKTELLIGRVQKIESQR
jgi:hypothetical protein